MTKLLWDGAGNKFFDAGVDKGVLYLSDNSGVPWNGLISIKEDEDGDSSDPIYFDGVKVSDVPSFGDYSATLTAFTYPDEFLEYEGVEEIGNGLYVDGQQNKLFGLSYRTGVGNDVDGFSHAYKIHVVYNLTASQEAATYESISDDPNLLDFSWKISAIPETAAGYRPTAHVILDSRHLNQSVLTSIERMLYGEDDVVIDIYDGGTSSVVDVTILDGGSPSIQTDKTVDGGFVAPLEPANARLPHLEELIEFISLFGPRKIIPNNVSGISLLILEAGDLTPSAIDGIFTALPGSRLSQVGTSGLYILV